MSKLLHSIQPYFSKLLSFLALISALCIASFVVLIVLDFVLRLLSWGSLPWLNEVLEYSLYLSVILSAPWLLQINGHVRLDIADQILSDFAAGKLKVLSEIIGGGICFVMAWYGLQATIEAFEAGTKQYKVLTIEIWWLLAVFALSMFLLAVEFVFRLTRIFEDLNTKGGS